MASRTGAAEPVGVSTGATLVGMTVEVVSAYLAGNHIQAGDVSGLIDTVHATLDRLARPSRPAVAPIRPKPPVPIRKTVKDAHIISLEDGKPYCALKRHLKRLGLTPESYREKWGLASDYPMAAPGFVRARSDQAKRMGLGSQLRRK